MKKFSKILAFAFVSVLLCFATVFSSSAADDEGKWIAAWGTGPTNVSLGENIAFFAEDMTGRSVITTTASGSKIRIKFTNYYGSSDLTLNQVTVAKSFVQNTINPNDVSSAIDVNTLKAVTFDGSPWVTIPAGKEIYSDPVNLEVEALENLSISYYIRDMFELKTMGLSGGTTFISTGGDKTQTASYGLMEHLVDEPDIYNLINSIFPTMGFDLKLAYKMITRPEWPSYGHFIEQGLTALPESFFPEYEDCDSLNHHFFGDIANWFISNVAGIKYNPDGKSFNKVIISPCFIEKLTFAEASLETPFGKVAVKWERKGNEVKIYTDADERLQLEVIVNNTTVINADGEYRVCI